MSNFSLLWAKGIGWNTSIRNIGEFYVLTALLIVGFIVQVIKLWRMYHE